MIKKTLYPKTKRLDRKKEVVTITEKIDGSNLSFDCELLGIKMQI